MPAHDDLFSLPENIDTGTPEAQILRSSQPHVPFFSFLGDRPSFMAEGYSKSSQEDCHQCFKQRALSEVKFDDLLGALSSEHLRMQAKIKELTELCEKKQCVSGQDVLSGGGEVQSDDVPVIMSDDSDAKTCLSNEVSSADGKSQTEKRRDSARNSILSSSDFSGHKKRDKSTVMNRTAIIKSSSIMDTIDDPMPGDRMRTRLHSLFRSNWCEPTIALMVIFDMVLLGWEADARVRGKLSETGLLVVIVLTKLLFCVDLTLRYYTYGAKLFRISSMVKLETLVCFLSVLDIILTIAFRVDVKKLSGILNMPRVFRLIRSARAGRMYTAMRPLWLLICGFRSSLVTMFWAAVLIFTVSYCFAILGMEMIPPTSRVVSNEYDRVAVDRFGDITSSIVSLFMILTLDDAAEVYHPLIMLGNSKLFCSLYFGCFIMLVAIAVMNLVTAALVQDSMEQAQQNKEVAKQQERQRHESVIPRLREMFALIDQDGSGEVSWQEIQQCPQDMQDELKNMTKADDLHEIFQLLDDDESGTVLIHEFLDT